MLYTQTHISIENTFMFYRSKVFACLGIVQMFEKTPYVLGY